jgi:putative ABC transport system ATP-binding protein
MALLTASHLAKSYRRRGRPETVVLANVSLAVERGSFVGLTGPSGSGKSTLLALLGGLDRPTRGHVSFDGQDLAGLSEAALTRVRRRFGFVFQNPSLIAGLPVWENVTYGLIPAGVPRRQRRRLGQSLLDRVALGNMADNLPLLLSGGEMQRVTIARALAAEPEVVIADEPTASLDPEAGASVAALFRAVHHSGVTVIVASHDPGLLVSATRGFALAAGTLAGLVTGVPLEVPGVRAVATPWNSIRDA